MHLKVLIIKWYAFLQIANTNLNPQNQFHNSSLHQSTGLCVYDKYHNPFCKMPPSKHLTEVIHLIPIIYVLCCCCCVNVCLFSKLHLFRSVLFPIPKAGKISSKKSTSRARTHNTHRALSSSLA